MGLDVSLYDGDTAIDEKSDKYPDNYNNKGYLRSSYNPSGFNHVVGDLLGKDLYYIFEPEEEYAIPMSKTRLNRALKRAKRVVSELKACEVPLHANSESPINKFRKDGQPAVDGQKAIQIVQEEMTKQRPPFFGGSFSNGQGSFHLDRPLEVIAMVDGVDVLGTPCFWVVTKLDLTYYLQQAEIVVEFIEKAITLKKPVVHWSS